MEITAVVRTDNRNIRLSGPRGSAVIFNGEGNPRQVRVHRPDGAAVERPISGKSATGSLVTAPMLPLAPRIWYTLRWRIQKEGMKVTVNGKLVFQELRECDVTSRSVISVGAYDSFIDVRSFEVRKLK
jgi:hypothetical protein